MANQQYEDEQFSKVDLSSIKGDKSSIVELQLEQDSILQRIYAFLTGKIWDTSTGKYIQDKDNISKINDLGAKAVLFEVSQRLSTPVILGHLTDHEAKIRALEFEISLSQKLVENANRWDIRSTSDMDIITDTLGDMIFCNFTRSIEGITHEGIIKMAQVKEVHSQAVHEREVQPQRQGLKSKIRDALF